MDVRVKALAVLLGKEASGKESSRKTLWLHPPAQVAVLDVFPGGDSCVVSPWKTVHDIFAPHRRVETQCPEPGGWDRVVVFPEKDEIAARIEMAQALSAARPGGEVIAVAENDAGGRRLADRAAALGVPGDKDSKHHCTVLRMPAPGRALLTSELPDHYDLPGGFRTTPGVFSSREMDHGSVLLTAHLPGDLHGAVGDFGCGWGALCVPLLRENPGIESLRALDADARALADCRKNVEKQVPEAVAKLETLWADLTDPDQGPKHLDAIVMNPPFHRGAATDAGLGFAFIAAAARALRPGGRLFLVANRHLPYEAALAKDFLDIRNLAVQEGFKVIAALRGRR